MPGWQGGNKEGLKFKAKYVQRGLLFLSNIKASSDPSTNVFIPERRAYKGDRKGVPERSRKARRVRSIGKR